MIRQIEEGDTKGGSMKEFLLTYSKETESKHRWDALVDDNTMFELYIPKWRIPDPVPGKILVRIFTDKKNAPFTRIYTRSEVSDDLYIRRQPIFAEVSFTEKLTKTFRYDPVGNNNQWEIGSPYIPQSVLLEYEKIDTLYLTVEWK